MKVWAVLKDVQGKSGAHSLTAWAGAPFKTYADSALALAECIATNKFYRENHVSDVAYVASGEMTTQGFISDKD